MINKKDKFFQVDIKYIKEPQSPVRKQIDEEKFLELCDSIRANGIIEPLIVFDCETHLEIIAGHRRYMAAREVGLQQIPVLLKNVSEDERIKLKIHENYGRDEVHALDEAEFFSETLKKLNFTNEELSKQISKSVQYIRNRLLLLEINEKLKTALRDEIISMSVALELNKIDNENELDRALLYARQNTMSARTAAGWTQQWEILKASFDVAILDKKDEQGNIVVGKVLWSCSLCTQAIDATEAYNMPFCPECRKKIIQLQNEVVAENKKEKRNS